MMLEVLKLNIVPSIIANRHFALVCAFAALANCGRSEVISAQEQFNNDPYDACLKGIVVHDPSAIIGNEEKHFKTPWMIVSPDAKKGFTNGFTTNAISVVSEDGVNYYAHQQDENGGRTNVIHFTVNKDGIPSRTGEVIDTTKSGEVNNAENMKKRKLIGVSHGILYFYPCEEYGTSLGYNPETGKVYYEEVRNEQSMDWELEQQEYLATCRDGNSLLVLVNARYKDYNGNLKERTRLKFSGIDGKIRPMEEWDTSVFNNDRKNITMFDDFVDYHMYTGDSLGNVYDGNAFDGHTSVATLPGAISGLSNNGDEVFATTKATNAFYNVTLGQYNVVKDENGDPKPMVPKTHDGLVKVIDNRKNGGKFLYVTSKGVHSIDD